MPDKSIYLIGDDLQRKVDYVSNTLNYIGVASPKAKDADPVWKIKRITLDTLGRPTEEQFADGNASLVHQWSERTSLEYK